MRTAVNILLLVVAIIGADAAPKLVWLNPEHDFGAFREEIGPVTCCFQAVNVGDEPLTVVDARANCGCTRPVYTREAVMPGDTLSVRVTYNPFGRPGRFRKQVKVTTNAEPSNSILTVSGTVLGSAGTLQSRYPIEVGPYRISKRIVPFGQTTKGHVLASAVNIYNTTTDSIRPAVENLPDFLNVLFRPEVIPPGEQGTMSLTAYTFRASGWGVLEDSFVLVPDSDNPEARQEIQTVMIVDEDFSQIPEEELSRQPKAVISASTLDFGTFSATDSVIRREFEIKNDGKKPMLIRRLYTPEPGIVATASTDKVKPGRSAIVTVSVNPGELSRATIDSGILNARITLIVNAPDKPTMIVRAIGEIK